MNHWNELFAISNNDKAKVTKYTTHNDRPYTWAAMATMLLGQFNTASGIRIKPEIERFVTEYKDAQKNKSLFSVTQDGELIATGLNSKTRNQAIKDAFDYAMDGKYSRMSLAAKENHLDTLGYHIEEHTEPNRDPLDGDDNEDNSTRRTGYFPGSIGGF